MPTHRGKSQVILDWFNVTYRSLFIGGGVVVLVLAGVGVWWVYSTRAPANQAIHNASIRYEEASVHSGEGRWDEMIASARVALAEARAEFERRDYVEAREAALRSEGLSQRVIDMAGGSQTAESGDVRFFRLEGDVRVKRSGEFAWESAQRNMTLNVGDQVKTSSSASAQIIYFDGTVTTVQPGSLLEIHELYENPVTKVRKVSEKLNWGEVLASTQRRNVEGSVHSIETEDVAALADDEGEIRVAYDRDQRTASFAVFDGRVEVAGRGSKEVLRAGERIESSEGRLRSKEVLPGVPRPVSPPDQRIFIYEDPASSNTRLAWERVPGAELYRLLISDRFLFTETLYDAERRDTQVVIDGITPGDYFWKVAALSPAGVEGPYSETRSFRVTTQKIRDTGDATPPKLEITDLVQTGAMLIINGQTEPGAQVWVDNDKVDVADDGTFYTVIRLRREGINRLQIVAQDSAGNQQVLQQQAYVEVY